MGDDFDWNWLPEFSWDDDWGDANDACPDSGDNRTDQCARQFYSWPEADTRYPTGASGDSGANYVLESLDLPGGNLWVQQNGMTESSLEPQSHDDLRQLQPKATQQPSNLITRNDDGFDFTSGCKPIAADDSGPTRHEKTRRGKKHYNTEFCCTVHNCGNKGPFKRRYELKRHMATHAQIKLSCPVISCNRRDPKGISRTDKLTEHLRNMHRDEDVLCICPVPGCSIEHIELDLLREHFKAHSYEQQHAIPETSALSSYAWDYSFRNLRQCPIPKCRKPRLLEPNKIPGQDGHLMTHDEQERTDHRTDALSKGYDSLTGHVVCPVCDHHSTGTEEFLGHLEDEHVLSESHRGFGATLRAQHGVSWWSAWKANPLWNRKLTCGFCAHQVAEEEEARNHPGLLKPSQDLLPYRRQILQLLPEFATHPVFDDIRGITQN